MGAPQRPLPARVGAAMTGLLDYLAEPKGDPAGKAMCFLQGGRYGGDRGSVQAPAPGLIAVSPCDCGSLSEERCGQPTHWHDVSKADELGDLPRHAAYYVLVQTQPAPSGMVGALYWYAGHERPTLAEIVRAQNDFERTVRQRAERNGVSADHIERN